MENQHSQIFIFRIVACDHKEIERLTKNKIIKIYEFFRININEGTGNKTRI